MGCGCKNKKKQARLREEGNSAENRRRREEQILKLRESVRNNLRNFKRLSK